MAVRCGKGHYHETGTDVRRCYNGERVEDVSGTAGRSEEPKPTEKQLSYIESLLRKSGLVYLPGTQELNRRSASDVISLLLDGTAKLVHPDFEPFNPANSFAHGTAHVEVQSGSDFEKMNIPGLGDVPVRKAPAFDSEMLDDGFYALPDPEGGNLPVVHKVIVAVHGSGRKYAKRLNTDTGEWDMARGAIKLLRPEHKMTLQQALDVAKVVAQDVNGALYGRCFKCGRVLTKEESIKRFMGDTCAASFK